MVLGVRLPGPLGAARGPNARMILRISGTVGAVAGSHDQYCLGIDFGTSGCRATVISRDDASEDGVRVVAEARGMYPTALRAVDAWETALESLVLSISPDVRGKVGRVCFDGTSATALLVDLGSGEVLGDARLYNEAQDAAVVQYVRSVSPEGNTTRAATSALCKLASWHLSGALDAARSEGRHPCLMHQCDWLAFLLHGKWASDWNNALKLGYDPKAEDYPAWMQSLPLMAAVPRDVRRPGQAVAAVSKEAQRRFGLGPGCVVHAGTTDSIAAFLAAGVREPGEAVTSLGSTLAVKLISERPVEDDARGVYSHRLGDAWLVGGASNVGGAVLRQFFSDDEIAALSERVDPDSPTGLGYYPLPSRGERFPVCDPDKDPVLEPRPSDRALFLQGILEGIADVEGTAYRVLADMGATPLKRVVSSGGGARNTAWSRIRERALGVPVVPAKRGEASFGAALLGMRG